VSQTFDDFMCGITFEKSREDVIFNVGDMFTWQKSSGVDWLCLNGTRWRFCHGMILARRMREQHVSVDLSAGSCVPLCYLLH